MTHTKATQRIDYSKYEVEELAETISDAIFFPLYIGKVFGTVLLVFLIGLTAFTLWFIPNSFLSVVFWVFVFLVSLPSVVLFSVIRLFSTIQEDMESVYEITLQTAINAYKDSGILKQQRQDNAPIKTTFTDVFRGVALFVIKPVLCSVLQKRIKFFSYPFIVVINLIFKRLVVKSTKNKTDLEQLVAEDSDSSNNEPKNYKLSQATFSVIKFPFRLALIIYGFVNFCLAYLFYQLFS